MIDNLQNKETIDQAKRKFIKDYHSTSRHLHSEIAKLNSLMTGGYGTSSQRIKLDAVLSYELADAIRDHTEEGTTAIKRAYQARIDKQNQTWVDTQRAGQHVGVHLSMSEIISALAAGGATEESIADKYVRHFEDKICTLPKTNEAFKETSSTFKKRARGKVEQDYELAVKFGIS